MIQDVMSGRLPGGFGFGRLPQGPGVTPRPVSSGAAVPVSTASASRDVTGSLSIVTREGDTVTLSASFDASVDYTNASGKASLQESLSRSVSLQVQGNLDPQEARDVARAVKRFLHDLRSMVNGGQPSLTNVTAGSSSTLSSIAATSDTQTRVNVVAASSRPPASPVPAQAADGGGGDAGSGAQPARLGAEDAGLQSGTPAPLPARGLVSTLPATPVVVAADAPATGASIPARGFVTPLPVASSVRLLDGAPAQG